jgi:uncharacterized membrane protein YdjX (TVP38/TMEM64 family)
LQALKRVLPRAAAGVAVVAGAVFAWSLIRRGAIDPAAIQNIIAGNAFAPAIFVMLQIVASLLFVPRTVLGIAAGLLFGFAWGAFWAILGAIAGAAAGFAFVRWIGGRKIDLEAMPRIGRIIERAETGGWRAVAIIRLIPGLPHSVVNTALALTKIGWRDYLLGSFIGMLPMTLLQVDVGAAGGEVLTGHGSWAVGCLLLALGLGATFLLKRTMAGRG